MNKVCQWACVYLIGLEACEAEHANLVDDMLPVAGRALLFQVGHQVLSHLDDAIGHAMNFLQPESERWRVENLRDEVS